jgi:hypothetical protein
MFFLCPVQRAEEGANKKVPGARFGAASPYLFVRKILYVIQSKSPCRLPSYVPSAADCKILRRLFGVQIQRGSPS